MRSPSLNPGESQSYYLEKRKRWINRYFEIFHPRWPFVHKGSFDVRQENPLLLQAMMALGMWTSGEKAAQSAAGELYDKLDCALRDQRVGRSPHHISDLLTWMYSKIGTLQRQQKPAAPASGQLPHTRPSYYMLFSLSS